ncbi:MAG: hypothetical protein P4L84_06765 [Isosphaeraceae bacterium]|nr:hypothetical protein [Isosphaeraceae bacterium]
MCRFTIGGLMWVAFALGFSFAALRNASEAWAGTVFLVTCGVLACAIVGVVCRPASERPWWLGFTLFGCGYLWLAFWGFPARRSPALPTTRMMQFWAAYFQVPLADPNLGVLGGFGGFQRSEGDFYLQIGHCLWSLLFATFGGMLATVLCGQFRGYTSVPSAVPDRDDRASVQWWRRPAAIVLEGSVLLVLVTLVGYPRNPELLAGASYLLTCALIGVAILGTVLAGGERRAAWLGAALFGGCYLVLHLDTVSDGPTWSPYRPANYVLGVVRPWLISGVRVLHGSTLVNDAANVRIRQKLDQCVPMSFPNDTPLEDVMRYVKRATEGPDDQGIPFYIDPIGLQEAEKTMRSPVQLDIDGLPLRTTLPLLLKQLGMGYFIRDGMLIVTADPDVEHNPDDPYFLIGHSVLTCLAAGVGSLLAPLVAGARRDEAATPA